MDRLRRAAQRLVSNGRQLVAATKSWPSRVHQGTPEVHTIAMVPASPSSSQGTQDASVPEELALDRGALRLLFCTKQKAAALLAVQGVQAGWGLRSAEALLVASAAGRLTRAYRCCLSAERLDLLRGLFVRFKYQGRYHLRAVEGIECDGALMVQVRGLGAGWV